MYIGVENVRNCNKFIIICTYDEQGELFDLQFLKKTPMDISDRGRALYALCSVDI